MSILRAAAVAQAGPFDRAAVVAAVFELADLGTLNISYDAATKEVTFTPRASASFNLTPEQRQLRSALFKNREDELTLSPREPFKLTTVNVDALYRNVAKLVINDSSNSVKRQITMPSAMLVLGLLYCLAVSLVVLVNILLGGAVALLIAACCLPPCVAPTVHFYRSTTTHRREEMLVDRGDNMISYMLLTASDDSYRSAEATIEAWAKGARHPSWWKSSTGWGEASPREVLAVWSVLMGAIS